MHSYHKSYCPGKKQTAKFMDIEIVFNEIECIVDKSNSYRNERIVLQLVERETGEEVLTATVNIPEVFLKNDEVIIKNYSENEGIFEMLIAAGILEDTGKRTETGMVTCPIARLLK